MSNENGAVFSGHEGAILSRRSLMRVAGGLIAGLALGSMSLTGCGSSTSSKAKDLEDKLAKGSDDVYEFTDSCGRTVVLPRSINTVTPSGPYAQILLCTLCPERMASLSSSFSKSQLSYIDSRMDTLPVLGHFYGEGGNLNFEELIKLNPDIIIDIGEYKTSIKEDMDGLQQKTGLPVIFVQATIDCFASAYRTLGKVLGAEARAEEMAQYIDEALGFAMSHRAEVVARDLRTIYSTGEYGYEVKAAGSVHSAALEWVGIKNIAELGDTNSYEVSPEQMMIWNPDILLLSPADGFYDMIYDDALWAGISAVENKRVYEVPGKPFEWLDSPPSIQTTLGVLWVGNLLCPDIYAFDMVEKTQTFFKLFWGYDLSESDARDMLAHSTFL